MTDLDTMAPIYTPQRVFYFFFVQKRTGCIIRNYICIYMEKSIFWFLLFIRMFCAERSGRAN